MSDVYPWGDNRRFNTYSGYFKREFGGRVQKLAIDAGFSCPNRDGTVATGGCTYCNNEAFNPSYCHPTKSITQQIEEGIEFHKVRYRRAKRFLAYFQAYSNTHAPIEHLRMLYEEALAFPGVIGLVIGTRPDCVDEEKLNYIGQLAAKHYVTLEYGVESCYNRTLEAINRGHTFEQSVWAIEETHRRGIKVGAHIILGLPGETRNEMLAEASILSSLPIHTVKFHQLQVIRGTVMAKRYELDPGAFQLFGMEEYLNFMVDVVERLNPNMVVERITGEAPPRFLATNGWGSYRTDQLMVMFEKLLEQRNTWQGRLYKG
ncbi:MAG: TIGR01212 family radical SAM protein [Bacteroidales bacterium]|jgi:radical SAM protein (TIGR01212 family)|nr:TIGR01212 family radical SAM protein [Bacteroidales bacterium]HOW21602.1 TIGR01212 family radical SAM protein [Tenuifilaceae bacterium]HPH00683.1 TIGR01212 family radical SAM protein [Tenuifilaceae bacterium]HPM90987.1 TIGR01212 family radical SAM protein [Tenuifilaceae bacterium]